jgi:DNA-binding MarR family transcriptional regulator
VNLILENISALAVSLENINKYINKIKNIKISEYGIKIAHFNFMMHIDLSKEGLTPTEISQDCDVDKAFVSRTTAELIKGGFIRINQKFNDGRKYRNKYILTEKGQSVMQETKMMIEKYLTEVCGKIGDIEMKSFIDIILSISENMNKKAIEA